MALFTQEQPIPTSVVSEDVETRLDFLQKVYSLFLLGLGVAIGGAFLTLANPGFAAAVLSHFFIGLILYFGVFFLCMAVRKTPGINILALLSFTFVSGVFIAPCLMVAALRTGGSYGVIYEAGLISGSIFLGLTAYVFITKKDFSFLSGIVWTGIWAVIGIGVVLMVMQMFGAQVNAASLALAWITSVLFSLFILYDTSRILRTHESDEYVSAALSLYLDFLNLFLAILRILSNNRR